MLNFVVCDDNSSILDKLSTMLDNIFLKHDFEAQVVHQGMDALQIMDFIKSNSIDVLILDINFKSSITGLDIAKELRKRNKNAYIIFSTAHLEYAMLAYKVKTFDYLPKPITYERLEETIIRLFNDARNNPKKYIRLDNKNTIIKQDDICYIKRDGMKIVFTTTTRDYEIYSSFAKIQNILPDNFIRCHKSYIANINKISGIKDNTTISFENNKSCEIGPKYKNNLLEVLNNDGIFSKPLDNTNYAE